jgi:F-type H+-transporting ATPase subunit gamma
MAGMREIRQRIMTIRDIEHITRAMKMVSVAKLHRAEAAETQSKAYREGLERIFDFVFAKMPRYQHPFFGRADTDGPTGVIAITSDKGLCGGYNTNVIRRIAAMRDTPGANRMKLMVVGKRGANMCRTRGIRLETHHAGLSAQLGVRTAGDLIDGMLRLYHGGSIARIVAVFNPYKRKDGRGVRQEVLLPMHKPEVTRAPEVSNYLYDPALHVVVDGLLKEILVVRMYGILLEAQLSEHLARMHAMDSASRNATDLIDALTLSYNKARQSAITNEIIDIIGGAEAAA